MGRILPALLLLLIFALAAPSFPAPAKGDAMELTVQIRCPAPDNPTLLKPSTRTLALDSNHTAVVVVDMWNGHSCKTVCRRVRELVKPMNQALRAARRLGLTVVFMPSLSDLYQNAEKQDFPKEHQRFYESHPARKRMLALPEHPVPAPSDFNPPPAPYNNAGCMCDPEQSCVGGASPKYRMQPDLEVLDTDYIGDGPQEMWNFLAENEITHVIHMGIAANMCILGKPQGIIPLKQRGVECILVRDLTDGMTANGRDPVSGRFDPMLTPDACLVDVLAHIEQHVAPTVNRAQILAAAGMEDEHPGVFPDRLADRDHGREFEGFPFPEMDIPAGHEIVMTPSGKRVLRPKAPRVFTPEDVAAYEPVGASNCYRHFTLDWNWQWGDLNDYFKRADPVEIAEFCERVNLDAVIFMAVSHQGYTTYPSELAPQWPALEGRDFYGEVVRECHKRGIAVLSYVSLARNWWYADLWPEQRWRRQGREWWIDLNTPFLEYTVALSQEVLRRYPVDGIRYDTLKQNKESHNRWSEQWYRELYGETLPAEWDESNWRRKMDFMRWSTTRATRMLTEGNHAIKPTIEVWQNGFIQQQDFDENDFEAGRWQDVAYIEAGDPFRQLLSTGVMRLKGTIVGHMFDQDAQTRRLCMALGARAYQFKAVNRETALPDDRQWYYDNMAPFYRYVSEIQPYLEGATPVPYVGVLFSEETRYRTHDYERAWYVYDTLKAFAMDCLERSCAVEFICSLDLPSRDYSHLRAIVVPETAGLTPEELEALRRYVHAGGQVLVAGEGLAWDREGRRRATFALADAMGVSLESGTAEDAGAWAWRTATVDDGERAKIDVAAAGPATLTMWMRETLATVDQIALTRDAAYRPSGDLGAKTPPEGTIVIQSETFARSEARSNRAWKVRRHLAGYGGDGFVQALLDKAEQVEGAMREDTPTGRIDEADKSPLAEYDVDFPAPGTWYVWVRQVHETNSDDSVFIGLDAESRVAFDFGNDAFVGAAEAPIAPAAAAQRAPWSGAFLPETVRAAGLVSVIPRDGETVFAAHRDGKDLPLLHEKPFGAGRFVYLATSRDISLLHAVTDALVGAQPVRCDPPDRQAILTRQDVRNRWVLHLLHDGDYTVEISREFAAPRQIAGQYPDAGWTAEAVGTDAGLRVRVSGEAKDRLLVLE